MRVIGVETLFFIPWDLDDHVAASSPALKFLPDTPVDAHILIVLAELPLSSLDGGHKSSVGTRPRVVFGVVWWKLIEFGCAQFRTNVFQATTEFSLRRTAQCTPSPPPASAPCPPAYFHLYECRPPRVPVHLSPYHFFRGVCGLGLVAAHAVVWIWLYYSNPMTDNSHPSLVAKKIVHTFVTRLE